MSSEMKKIAALFPGQGSQHVGMGKNLFENFKQARELFEEASDAIRMDLKTLCFEGPESDLTLTANTQPCLLLTSVAAFRVTEAETGFKPWVAAGHSLGEYSALVAAGAFPFASAVRWVHERGKAMQMAVPAGQGSMAALLNMDDEKVQALCQQASLAAVEKRKTLGPNSDLTVEPVVQAANLNSPGQVVIAGSVDAVQEAITILKTHPDQYPRAKAIPLSVSAPFHSSLMRPARDRMAQIFSSASENEKPHSLQFSYVPNRTARLTSEPGVVFELLTDQVDHPVLWTQSIETLLHAGVTQAIEFGPGKVLQGLCKRIASAHHREWQLSGIADGDGLRGFMSPSS